ncbi:Response regulator transcription factor [Rhodovastum atsumiense]|nr:Response regulator transcription factor [Rhodovastum atsumiense]
MLRVLIVEDSPTVSTAIAAALRDAGMETHVVASGAAAIAEKSVFRPDVALLDLELPDVNGLELVARFAQDADCGIIVVTVDGAEQARITGLETGADDYIVKPAPLRELAARIRAVHRRLSRPDPEPDPAAPRGPLVTLDCARRLLSGPNEENIALTEAETAALEALLDADGGSVSREWLSQTALKRSLHADDRSVDQLVLKLRRKVASAGASDRTILSARRHGYVIPDPAQFRILPPRIG